MPKRLPVSLPAWTPPEYISIHSPGWRGSHNAKLLSRRSASLPPNRQGASGRIWTYDLLEQTHADGTMSSTGTVRIFFLMTHAILVDYRLAPLAASSLSRFLDTQGVSVTITLPKVDTSHA